MNDYYDTPAGKEAIAIYLKSINAGAPPSRRRRKRSTKYGAAYTLAILLTALGLTLAIGFRG